MRNTKQNRFAFTLAEVLITLGIIGVVAAMTIPTLMTNYKAKRLHSQFLKSYSTVQQAFKMMENDDVSLDPSTYASEDKMFYKTFINYLSGATDCRYKSNPQCYHGGKGYTSFDGKASAASWLFDDGMVALQDGTLLLFENATNNVNNIGSIYVSVDLNGYEEKPNRWGYDLFTFQFLDGELKTMGDKGTYFADVEQYCNSKVSNIHNGIACAQKAKEDSDYFKKLITEFK